MAKKGEHEFDDFDMLGEEAAPESLPDLSEDLPDLTEGEPLADFGDFEQDAVLPAAETTAKQSDELAVEEEIAAEEKQEEQAEERKAEKVAERRAGTKPSLLDRLPANRELIVAVALPVLFVLLWLVGLVYLSSGIYLLAVASVPYGLWRYRDTNSIFTVLLGCALVGILTGVFCLWREWGSLGFDRKAKALHPTASVVRLVDGPTSRLA